MLREYILVVDDDPSIIDLLKTALEKNGFNVISAENILSAKLLLKKFPNIWAGIFDYQLPDGTGMELLKLVREINPLMLNVLLTGHSNHQLLIECINSSLLYKYFEKPVQINDIIKTLNEMQGLYQLRHRAISGTADEHDAGNEYVQHNIKLIQMGQLSLAILSQIRNPLQLMRLNIDYMKKHRKYSEVALKQIQNNIDNINNSLSFLISHFSHESHINKEQLEVSTFLKEISDNLLQLLKHPGRMNFRVQFTEKPNNIYVNPSHFEQIVFSILQNAFEAAMQVQAPKVKLTTYKDYSYFYIKISDNGPGISPENKEKIFNPFFSSKRENSESIWLSSKSEMGLGIWLCNLLIKDYGGEISFETSPEGTSFYIKIPLIQLIKKNI